MNDGIPTTSVTLIGRLRQSPSNPDAWTEFAERYAPLIYQWCVRWGLQDADANDLTQEILVKLLQSFQQFAYDPNLRFRSWLKTVTHNAWVDSTRTRARRLESSNSPAASALDSVEAGDDLASEMEAAYERELFEEGMARVRLRVQPATWDAFHLTVVERLDGATVAKQLKMTVAAVYKARSNVQKLLREEVRHLERDMS